MGGINIYLGRAVDIIDNNIIIDNNKIPVDIIIFCQGRTPNTSLSTLNLKNGNIAYDINGIITNKYLQSITNRNIYACGDCISSTNNILPKLFFLLRSDGAHDIVPRVYYTDPELSCIGLTYKQCIEKYSDNIIDTL